MSIVYPLCSIENCELPLLVKKDRLCARHRRIKQKYGDPNHPVKKINIRVNVPVHTQEYRIWVGMKTRCRNKNSISYPKYGARGITICERWLTFANFFADMGERPSPDHTVDRIDNDRGYYPENCRWATKELQVRNQRMRKTNKSGYRGVIRYGNKWRASIKILGKTYNLGSYSSPEKAAEVYQEALNRRLSEIL